MVETTQEKVKNTLALAMTTEQRKQREENRKKQEAEKEQMQKFAEHFTSLENNNDREEDFQEVYKYLLNKQEEKKKRDDKQDGKVKQKHVVNLFTLIQKMKDNLEKKEYRWFNFNQSQKFQLVKLGLVKDTRNDLVTAEDFIKLATQFSDMYEKKDEPTDDSQDAPKETIPEWKKLGQIALGQAARGNCYDIDINKVLNAISDDQFEEFIENESVQEFFDEHEVLRPSDKADVMNDLENWSDEFRDGFLKFFD